MARITITSNRGTVIDLIKEEEIGDLEKPLPQASLMESIKAALKFDRENPRW